MNAIVFNSESAQKAYVVSVVDKSSDRFLDKPDAVPVLLFTATKLDVEQADAVSRAFKEKGLSTMAFPNDAGKQNAVVLVSAKDSVQFGNMLEAVNALQKRGQQFAGAQDELLAASVQLGIYTAPVTKRAFLLG